MKDKITTKLENTKAKIINKLRQSVQNLINIKDSDLDNAICDIIDLRGYSIAVLLEQMPFMPQNVQMRIASKLEDFFFFKPTKGKKLLKRLAKTINNSNPETKPMLLSAFADVYNSITSKNKDIEIILQIAPNAIEVLNSSIDFMRKSKAIEILGYTKSPKYLPPIIKYIPEALKNISTYSNYTFTESALFAIKKLGGDSVLRLLINKNSIEAKKLLRLEWRKHSEEDLKATLLAIESLNEDIPAMLLKVVELSEYGYPFVEMIKEGLEHPDKWVRQVATASMNKMADKHGFEQLIRMVNDSSIEVKLMAISSLGSYDISKTGEILKNIALNENELYEARLNALYALYKQKNFKALNLIRQSPSINIAANAAGLAALLLPHDKAIRNLLHELTSNSSQYRNEIINYILELAQPTDVSEFISFQQQSLQEENRSDFLRLFKAFLQKNKGTLLYHEISKLDHSSQKIINSFLSETKF